MNQMNFGNMYVCVARILNKENKHRIYIQVALKTRDMLISQTDAIFEVYTDRIVQKSTNCDKALLWILSQAISEFSVCLYSITISYS